jgi:hypothetical protein
MFQISEALPPLVRDSAKPLVNCGNVKETTLHYLSSGTMSVITGSGSLISIAPTSK